MAWVIDFVTIFDQKYAPKSLRGVDRFTAVSTWAIDRASLRGWEAVAGSFFVDWGKL